MSEPCGDPDLDMWIEERAARLSRPTVPHHVKIALVLVVGFVAFGDAWAFLHARPATPAPFLPAAMTFSLHLAAGQAFVVPVLADDRCYCSPPDWGAKSAAQCVTNVRDATLVVVNLGDHDGNFSVWCHEARP